MYPELLLGGVNYVIDTIIPLIGISLFVIFLYGIVKSNKLRFRDIVSKIPLIVITTLLMGSYVNFILYTGKILPTSVGQFFSILSLSVDTLDFVGIVVGCGAATILVLYRMHYSIRYQWIYVLILTYLMILVPLGVLYTLGDSVIGRFNDGFFSIGSFVQQSRIDQLGGSVYPIGLLISAWSSLCIMILLYLYRRNPQYAGYRTVAGFMLGYIVILHYQHYPRYLIVNIYGLQADLRSYVCIAIACIALYFGYNKSSVYRFSQSIHEDSIGKAR